MGHKGTKAVRERQLGLGRVGHRITKATDNCVKCGEYLPKNHKHHWKCDKCWKEDNKE